MSAKLIFSFLALSYLWYMIYLYRLSALVHNLYMISLSILACAVPSCRSISYAWCLPPCAMEMYYSGCCLCYWFVACLCCLFVDWAFEPVEGSYLIRTSRSWVCPTMACRPITTYCFGFLGIYSRSQNIIGIIDSIWSFFASCHLDVWTSLTASSN
jgi:hypothetical protein